MPRLQAPSFCLVAIAAGFLGACGSNPAAPDPANVDDAYSVRIAGHQQTASRLAKEGLRSSRPDVRRIARTAVRFRRKLLPALQEQAAAAPTLEHLPQLGISANQAAEEIRPDALDGAKPLDAAFLTVMKRHDEGALVLARAEIQNGKDQTTRALAKRLSIELIRETTALQGALVRLSSDQRRG